MRRTETGAVLLRPDQGFDGRCAVQLDIITIFPEYFAPLRMSLIGKAVERGDIAAHVHDLRSWTHDPHRTVDDTPFGGGPGMVMRPEPWGEALDEVLGAPARVGAPGGAGLAEPGGTCSQAGNLPSWSWLRRSAGCCRASSATPSPFPTTRSVPEPGRCTA